VLQLDGSFRGQTVQVLLPRGDGTRDTTRGQGTCAMQFGYRGRVALYSYFSATAVVACLYFPFAI